MLRLICKLAVVTAAFAGSVLLLCYYFASAGAPCFIPWEIGCPLSLLILLLAGELGEALFPQPVLIQKAAFRVISRGMFCAALCLWFFIYIIVVMLVTVLQMMLFGKKKRSIHTVFAAYLQKQGIPEDSVREELIRFSLWNLVRDRPAWIIEAEFADTPGIRRFFYEDHVVGTLT